MLDSRILVMVIVGGIIAPAGLVWWIYTSGDDALILISAQWINWSIYSLGFLCGALMSLIGGHLLRSHWMMIFALGCLYWAAGCMMGGLQAGNNPALAPIIALPYVRAMWLLGAAYQPHYFGSLEWSDLVRPER